MAKEKNISLLTFGRTTTTPTATIHKGSSDLFSRAVKKEKYYIRPL